MPALHKDPATDHRNNRGRLRWQRILQSADSCFARHGYEGTTVAMIAADAGIRPATLYNYVTDKEQVAEALCRQYAADLSSVFDRFGVETGDVHAELVQLLGTLATYTRSHMGIGIMLLPRTERMHEAYASMYAALLAGMTRFVDAHAGDRPAARREVVADIMAGEAFSLLYRVNWVAADHPEHLADEYATMLAAYLRAPAPDRR